MKRSLLLLAILVLLLAGCGKAGTEAAGEPLAVPPEEVIRQFTDYQTYLGLSDEALVAELGEGTPSYQDIEELKIIAARVYEEELFTYKGEAAFVYGDDGAVNEITLSFAEASREAILAQVAAALGEPQESQADEAGAYALWLEEDFCYTFQDDGGFISITIGPA